MDTVLVNTPFTLSVVFYEDEAPTAADGAVNVTVTDSAGATVASGAATADPNNTGRYTFPVSAQTSLGVLTASWVGAFAGYETTINTATEVVGAFLFTIAELRAIDPDLTATTYPTDKVRSVRGQVASEFERITKRSFVPRAKTVTVSGDNTTTAYIRVLDPIAVTAATIDGTAQDVAGWGFTRDGLLQAPTAILEGSTAVVSLTYGFQFVPDDVRRAALTRARYLLVADRSGIPDRATSFTATEGGTFALATPGRAGWETGIPDVDATLARYSYNLIASVGM